MCQHKKNYFQWAPTATRCLLYLHLWTTKMLLKNYISYQIGEKAWPTCQVAITSVQMHTRCHEINGYTSGKRSIPRRSPTLHKHTTPLNEDTVSKRNDETIELNNVMKCDANLAATRCTITDAATTSITIVNTRLNLHVEMEKWIWRTKQINC